MNMNAFASAALVLLAVLIASDVHASDAPAPPAPSTATSAAKAAKVRQVEWDELLPKEERDNFSTAPPPPMHDYLGGGPSAMQSGSSNVNLALNGASVKIPGFIVPLDVSADRMVTEFFLVPYYGACIHVPPPPPNQIVYVKLSKAIKVDSLVDAQWVTGRLRTETRNSRYGAAAYTLDGDKVETYKY
jgi:hypothetical protein